MVLNYGERKETTWDGEYLSVCGRMILAEPLPLGGMLIIQILLLFMCGIFLLEYVSGI